MRSCFAMLLLCLSLPSSGCALLEDGTRNTFVSLCAPIEAHREKARNREWAESAWRSVGCASGARSEDYAQGFKDGYAEYLFRGGEGETPLVAPLRYRHIRYQTPTGYLAIEDWFAGYRHGVLVAKESGARRFITGPSGLLAPTANEPVPISVHEPAKLTGPLPGVEILEAQPLQPSETSLPLGPPMVPETLRIKINGVREAPPAPPVPELPAQLERVRMKITNIHDASSLQEPNNDPPHMEPMRIKIKGVSEPPPATGKARITGISVPPQPGVEPPARARIMGVTPSKE